ncbi:MAG: hypothetical protein H7096_08425 [Flavobacterium sp.]|nr:hypothetical protein [Pedobacter sp.]
MKTEKVIWGLVLIFIGVVFLLNNFGVINFYWGSVWRFWPIIFVLIGANMIFSRFNNLTGTILSIGLTLTALIFLGYQGTRPNRNDEGRSRFGFNGNLDKMKKGKPDWASSNKFTEAYLSNAKYAELNIGGGATSFKMEGSTGNLFDADVKQNVGSFTLGKISKDSVEVLNFMMRDKKERWNMDDMDGNEVRIKLNKNPIWKIGLEVGAGETDFDLSGYKVSSLSLKGGVASYKIKLPEPTAIMDVSAETGVADVSIEVPEVAACRITIESGLSSKDFSGFDKQADGSYQTSDYASASKKINIHLKGGLSSFEVSRY